ncbi:MAG TPA: PIN domain-containing protein [Candidatus Limnocylindria bacterium]|nr:PIN domain-containing protein [Candidatus Limnocylindria bacterium]
MGHVITFDTSALLALLNRRDPDHERIKQVVDEERGPYLVPAGILAEITYMVERRLGARALDLLLADLESGALTFECGESDLARIRALVSRYADLPLGYADAAVVACAERSGGRVLTLDTRDFGVVAAEGRVTILPE